MHTIEKLYFTEVPIKLFRGGNSISPKFENVRTVPPRTLDQSFEVELYQKKGVDYVGKYDGGISTFDRITSKKGHWWVLGKGIEIPPELCISRL